MAQQYRPPNPYLRDRNKEVLDMYVVYDKPKDFPNKFVVRRWKVVDGEMEPAADKACQTADNLLEARLLIPKGYYRIPRMAEDDPVIVEAWV